MLRISSPLSKVLERQQKQIEKLKQRSALELETLSPSFQRHVATILLHLEGKGWSPVVFHGERTKEEQAEKVKAGYSKTLNSFHVAGSSLNKGRNGLYWRIKGEAADIVDVRFLWSGPAEDLDFQFWSDLGAIARTLGLVWGGDWKKFRDVAHVEVNRTEFTQDVRGTRV